MALKMGYATLRWRQPDLAKALPELKKAGWDGWEGRLPLDWLGPPKRLKQVCEDADMPLCVFTASGSPEDRDWEHTERNKRRMDFAAEMGVDCFMFMSGRKPEGRPVERADIERAAEGAEQWAEYASQYGLELSYHIHTNLLVDSAEDWRLYMSLLDKARLCIDVSHAELWDYDPVQSLIGFLAPAQLRPPTGLYVLHGARAGALQSRVGFGRRGRVSRLCRGAQHARRAGL